MDRIVLKWCSFDGDKPSGYYRLRYISDIYGYEQTGVIEWRPKGQKKWEVHLRDIAITDLAIALDREKHK